MTQDTHFSAKLCALAAQHFRRAIDLAEYRCQRRKVLEDMDRCFNSHVAMSKQHDNGLENTQLAGSEASNKPDDATVPYRRHRRD